MLVFMSQSRLQLFDYAILQFIDAFGVFLTCFVTIIVCLIIKTIEMNIFPFADIFFSSVCTYFLLSLS